MAEVHVHPNKLPCDEESSFVVVLKHPLPKQTSDFSLMFKGIRSGREILGRAVKVDQKTLIGVVGAYGKAEEVEVRVVGLSTSVRVDPFRITFCTRFQLICGLFPDDVPLQAPVAVACCLHRNNDDDDAAANSCDPDANCDGFDEPGSNANLVDEELADFCKRNVPTDLSFKRFFGSDMIATLGGKASLLHFAAERGYKQFAAYLLAESGGAYDAISSRNREGKTPANIVEERRDDDMIQLFIDYEEVAAENAVPLTEYADFQKLMSEYNYVKMEQKDAPVKKKKKSKKHLLGKIVKWRAENRGKPPENDEEKKKKSIFRLDMKKIARSIGARLETLRKHVEKTSEGKATKAVSADSIQSIEKRRREPLPPVPQISDDDLIEEFDNDCLYEDIESSDMKTPPQRRPKSHYMKKVIAKGVVKKDYIPMPGDTESLRLKRGQEVNIFQDSGAPWVIGECGGKEGRIQKSVISIFDPDYEADVGGTLQDGSSEEEEEEFGALGETYEDTTSIGSGRELKRRDSKGSSHSNTRRRSSAFIAMHDWIPEHDDDLKIYEGEIIEVLEMSDSGWWKAKNSRGKTGTVPSTYLKETSGSPSPRPLGSKSSGESVDSAVSDDIPAPRKFTKPTIASSAPSANPPSISAKSPSSGPVVTSKKPPSGFPPTKQKPPKNKPKPTLAIAKKGPNTHELAKVLSRKKQEVEASSSTTLPSPKRPISQESEDELSRVLNRKKKELELSATLPSPSASSPREPFQLALSGTKKGPKGSPVDGKAPPPTAKKPTGKTDSSAGRSRPAVAMKPPVAVKPPQKSANSNEYRCLWDYEPESADDLLLRQGDIVVVTARSNKDWWIGECNGNKGIFPASFVEKIN